MSPIPSMSIPEFIAVAVADNLTRSEPATQQTYQCVLSPEKQMALIADRDFWVMLFFCYAAFNFLLGLSALCAERRPYRQSMECSMAADGDAHALWMVIQLHSGERFGSPASLPHVFFLFYFSSLTRVQPKASQK
ncbi:uncharacterized protein DSM5745_09958 [Aspergillus mulundensis]|uniref:Uncharacterized protein n=1 Tax=Aspergillus mulundensis TaxID=1810919 RepID=A0A3D8QRZ3_9EURO|nr:hypothetical protein DSM5745_09958 [Aspergillus mulundensis]RDW64547.1 hypothetical protein DSM5745_09958 [Aspergillus mulundensis]